MAVAAAGASSTEFGGIRGQHTYSPNCKNGGHPLLARVGRKPRLPSQVIVIPDGPGRGPGPIRDLMSRWPAHARLQSDHGIPDRPLWGSSGMTIFGWMRTKEKPMPNLHRGDLLTLAAAAMATPSSPYNPQGSSIALPGLGSANIDASDFVSPSLTLIRLTRRITTVTQCRARGRASFKPESSLGRARGARVPCRSSI